MLAPAFSITVQEHALHFVLQVEAMMATKRITVACLLVLMLAGCAILSASSIAV
jgi:hypothetical protein